MTSEAGASRHVPTGRASVGTAETRGNPGCPDCPDRPDQESRGALGNEADRSGLRAWLRRLPAVEPDIEAEERAAIQAEARGDFGLPKPKAEHQAFVAALLRGYEAHRHLLLRPADEQGEHANNGTEE